MFMKHGVVLKIEKSVKAKNVLTVGANKRSAKIQFKRVITIKFL